MKNYTRKFYIVMSTIKKNKQYNVLTKGATSDWGELGMTSLKRRHLNEIRMTRMSQLCQDLKFSSERAGELQVDGTPWAKPRGRYMVDQLRELEV